MSEHDMKLLLAYVQRRGLDFCQNMLHVHGASGFIRRLRKQEAAGEMELPVNQVEVVPTPDNYDLSFYPLSFYPLSFYPDETASQYGARMEVLSQQMEAGIIPRLTTEHNPTPQQRAVIEQLRRQQAETERYYREVIVPQEWPQEDA